MRNVNSVKGRDGVLRHYLRKVGYPPIRLFNEPGTAAFDAELASALRKARGGLDGVEYVYFVHAEAEGAVKIGKSVDPNKRLNALQVSRTDKLSLLGCIKDRAGGTLERDIHGKFKALRIRGEWFRAEPGLLAFIRRRARH